MSADETTRDDVPEEFLDQFFERGDDPEGWSIIWIEMEPEDSSVDPAGSALQPTRDDSNELARSVAEEQSHEGGEVSAEDAIDPNAIPLDSDEIQAEANKVLPELEDELRDANLRARESRKKALQSAEQAGFALREAADSFAQAARDSARPAFLSFHSWSMASYRRCLRTYDAGNRWAKDHPLGLAILTVIVSVAIAAAG